MKFFDRITWMLKDHTSSKQHYFHSGQGTALCGVRVKPGASRSGWAGEDCQRCRGKYLKEIGA